ncbi:hypothetical protein EUGRSUZ_D00927 [Eucalyptus grandis]|uniref:Uncharacterized protein n=2 Tax=Eucalyptus grandis TaxID=71139 RepID=A0ACC3L3Z3_EUCGR|nr:hypothetical protein EUGRSUZ_D00927 [Eucalyptus grandis]
MYYRPRIKALGKCLECSLRQSKNQCQTLYIHVLWKKEKKAEQRLGWLHTDCNKHQCHQHTASLSKYF